MPISGILRPFSKPVVDEAIDAPGVYGLYDATGACIYYGSSENSVRERLQRHLSGAEGPCTQAAASFRQELSANPAVRESTLLSQHALINDVLPKCNGVMPRAS